MDRRQKKTRNAIYAAFEDLMAKEHYQKITVARIIEAADIGRSTFYAHFETKDELLDKICTEIFDHIFEGVNSECITHPSLKTADLEGKLAHLLYHLRDAHQGVCGKLLCEGEPHFTAYFRKRLTELLVQEQPRIDGDIPRNLAAALMVSSFCEAVTWWLDQNEAHYQPEQMSHWYLALFDASTTAIK